MIKEEDDEEDEKSSSFNDDSCNDAQHGCMRQQWCRKQQVQQKDLIHRWHLRQQMVRRRQFIFIR